MKSFSLALISGLMYGKIFPQTHSHTSQVISFSKKLPTSFSEILCEFFVCRLSLHRQDIKDTNYGVLKLSLYATLYPLTSRDLREPWWRYKTVCNMMSR